MIENTPVDSSSLVFSSFFLLVGILCVEIRMYGNDFRGTERLELPNPIHARKRPSSLRKTHRWLFKVFDAKTADGTGYRVCLLIGNIEM